MEHHLIESLIMILTVLIAAQVGAEIAQRLKLPSVVGEITAGCIFGPSLLNLIRLDHNQILFFLSEFGAILLLFSVGLETLLKDLKKVGGIALLSGTIGVIFPFILGGAWASAEGYNFAQCLFIGSAFVATSAGITARVLQELQVINRMESRVILGAAVIDDILAMLLLGVVTALQKSSVIDVTSLSITAVQSIGFVLLAGFGGTLLMSKFWRVLDAPLSTFSPLSLSLSLCILMAVISTSLGLAAIIGAFLAGMIIAESPHQHTLQKQLEPLLIFIVPFFFVVSGAMVDVSQLSSLDSIYVVAIVTLLAVFSKLIGCGVGALALGKKSALIVGVGMIPRGEVGIIIASLGRSMKLFDDKLYTVLIVMSLLTSIIAPPILGKLFVNLKQELLLSQDVTEVKQEISP
jgi:Kef-type K+ transport system membrane component KefB